MVEKSTGITRPPPSMASLLGASIGTPIPPNEAKVGLVWKTIDVGSVAAENF